MLTKIESSAMPTIQKTINGADASLRGAFAFGTVIDFTVKAPRMLGASAVVLRACKDGGASPVPTSQIIYNQAILDGIAKSAELGREIEIEIPNI